MSVVEYTALPDAEEKIYSQNGEDGVIKEIFKRVGLLENGTLLEFGTETGEECCSRALIELSGWGGLLIDATQEGYNGLSRMFGNCENVNYLMSYVTPENINDIIDNYSLKPDMIVIDIDSIDYQIFEAIKHRPILFVVEYNASLPLDKETSLVNESKRWDTTANFGASLGALEKIAEKKQYSLVHTNYTGSNAFFIRDDFLHLFPESKNPQRNPARYIGCCGPEATHIGHLGLDLNTFIEY